MTSPKPQSNLGSKSRALTVELACDACVQIRRVIFCTGKIFYDLYHVSLECHKPNLDCSPAALVRVVDLGDGHTRCLHARRVASAFDGCLSQARGAKKTRDVTFVRLEQIAPFPFDRTHQPAPWGLLLCFCRLPLEKTRQAGAESGVGHAVT